MREVTHRAPRFDELLGLWSRSLIVFPDGRQDGETWANWMQGPRIYIDLRQPPSAPHFQPIRGLRGLSEPQVRWLAEQEGFAGSLNFDGAFFEWRREIDFQPQAIYSDQGELWFEGDKMIERGRDIPYFEHWHAEPIGLAPVCGMRLRDRTDGALGFLLRVGSLFMYARDRLAGFSNSDGETGKHLRDYVAGATDLHAAQDLIDCEISQGAITSAGWIIQRSTLPFRMAQSLEPQLLASASTLATSDTSHDGRPMRRSWEVVDIEGSASSLLNVAQALPVRRSFL